MTPLLDETVKEMVLRARADVIKAAKYANETVKGRRVRIISEHRDQPYGRSKPSLKGKEYVAKFAYIEAQQPHIFVDGLWCGIPLDSVEFLND